MAWPTVTLNSWEEFLEIATKLTVGSAFRVANLFRGQSRVCYDLKPSLLRYLKIDIKAEEAIEIEEDALREFQRNAALNLPINILPSKKDDLFGWWSVMQHHSSPTRFLDWTASPYIAAYFAVERDWEEHDGVIYLFDINNLSHQMMDQYGIALIEKIDNFNKNKESKIIQTWCPDVLTERMVAQQGNFTISPYILADHGLIIDKALAPVQNKTTDILYRKFIIPREQKPIFLRHLRAMNISASALFPGVDGLGRTITELTRLENFFPEKKTKFVD